MFSRAKVSSHPYCSYHVSISSMFRSFREWRGSPFFPGQTAYEVLGVRPPSGAWMVVSKHVFPLGSNHLLRMVAWNLHIMHFGGDEGHLNDQLEGSQLILRETLFLWLVILTLLINWRGPSWFLAKHIFSFCLNWLFWNQPTTTNNNQCSSCILIKWFLYPAFRVFHFPAFQRYLRTVPSMWYENVFWTKRGVVFVDWPFGGLVGVELMFWLVATHIFFFKFWTPIFWGRWTHFLTSIFF